MTRQRLAPKAVRIAISFCRTVAFDKSKLATLAQAISNTHPTAPNKSSSVGLILPVSCSCRGTTVTPQSFFEAG